MKKFSTDLPNDRNVYGDNIVTKKVDYVIPETYYSWDKCVIGWCSLLLVT